MTSTFVKIPQLQILASRGYDLAVLSAIEEAALMQAVEMREAKGLVAHPAGEARALAASLVPSGARLDQLYVETLAGMRSMPLRTLQRVADHLAFAAAGLEQTAARAASRPVTLGQYAKIQGAIGHRYAQIILAAQTMESAGMVPIHLQGRLSNLTERPDGPLEAFYDKAYSIAEATRAEQPGPENAKQINRYERAA